MKPETIRVIRDAKVPVRHCLIIAGDEVVYAGPLGAGMVHHIVSGAELYLNPHDFAEGMDFKRRFDN